eukprot:scaffold93909_cov54-Phaeocystis_antarctica.AAC.2
MAHLGSGGWAMRSRVPPTSSAKRPRGHTRRSAAARRRPPGVRVAAAWGACGLQPGACGVAASSTAPRASSTVARRCGT